MSEVTIVRVIGSTILPQEHSPVVLAQVVEDSEGECGAHIEGDRYGFFSRDRFEDEVECGDSFRLPTPFDWKPGHVLLATSRTEFEYIPRDKLAPRIAEIGQEAMEHFYERLMQCDWEGATPFGQRALACDHKNPLLMLLHCACREQFVNRHHRSHGSYIRMTAHRNNQFGVMLADELLEQIPEEFPPEVRERAKHVLDNFRNME